MTINPRKALSCLYFPYADPQPTPGLLMAALLFDKIYFLEPNFFRPPEERLGQYAFSRLPLDMRELGVFHEIGPDLMGFGRHFYSTQAVFDASLANEFKASIAADLNNLALRELSAQHGKQYWRIPNGQMLFWNGLGILFESLLDQQDASLMTILTSRPDYYGPQLQHKYKRSAVPYESDEETRVRHIPEELTVRVPFLIAEALMIAVSLYTCAEFELVPFTDNSLHHRYLILKLQALQQQLSSYISFSEMSKNMSYAQLGAKTLELSLPRIENLTVEKVHHLRDACKDELKRFRAELLKLQLDLQSTPWNPQYEQEQYNVIQTKILPALEELESKLQSLKQKFAIDLLEKGLTTSPLPLLLNVFAHLPLSLVLPASIGAISLKQSLDHFQQRSELRRNGLSLLLHLR
jgi:hypothetical protein